MFSQPSSVSLCLSEKTDSCVFTLIHHPVCIFTHCGHNVGAMIIFSSPLNSTHTCMFVCRLKHTHMHTRLVETEQLYMTCFKV